LQLGELQDHVEAFEAAGIGIVAITYDDPELQQNFIDAGELSYPFLSDIDAATMIALGILNEEYSPGDRAYGIPHPGVFVVDPNQQIVGKIFVDSFRIRVDGAGVLEYALEVLD
jgi:peroxiredoxin